MSVGGAAAWEPRCAARWEVDSKPCPWSYAADFAFWVRGEPPSQPTRLRSHSVANSATHPSTPSLRPPTHPFSRIAIVKLTPGERWLGMRRWADTCFILTFVISQGLGETSWLSTAKKRTQGRGGKGGGCSRGGEGGGNGGGSALA